MSENNQLSIQEFAAKIKAKDARLTSVPDDVLVRKVFERRPDLMSRVRTMEERPGNLIQQLIRSSPQMIKNIAAAGDRPTTAIWNLGAPHLAALLQARSQGDPRAKQELATLPGRATSFLAPFFGGIPAEERVTQPSALRNLVDRSPVKASYAWGIETRAKQAMDAIESNYGHIPIEHSGTMKWADKIIELGKKGYNVPKPVTDFIRWIEEGSAPNRLSSAPGGGFVDVGPQMNPLTLRDARAFYTSLGEAIPWEQYGGKGGRMFRLVKDMRGALGDATIDALEPHGMSRPYRQALANFSRAADLRQKAGPLGYIGGKIAGYGVGGQVGHPFVLGHAGGKLGESAAEDLVRSVIGAGGGK